MADQQTTPTPTPNRQWPRVRVLLTEGSSLTARDVVTCLGPAGHHMDVLDPEPPCLARFSRWVRRMHRCPLSRAEPVEYLRTLDNVVRERAIDVVLPTRGQAWLLSAGRPMLADDIRVAVADADAFARVQSKVAFARLLDDRLVGVACARPRCPAKARRRPFNGTRASAVMPVRASPPRPHSAGAAPVSPR